MIRGLISIEDIDKFLFLHRLNMLMEIFQIQM